MEKKTELYDRHVAMGGRIVPFAGYLLPVMYENTGVIAEHIAVRKAAGLFDVSHMGEVRYKGKDALANLNRLLSNDFTGMYDGQARYSPMLNENGGFIDDLIVYKKSDNDYMVVVNAANRSKDVEWMMSNLSGDVEFSDISDSISQIAIQGPASREIIKRLTPFDKIPQKYYSAVFNSSVAGFPCILSRTGYTGEFGYEIYTMNENAGKIWDALLESAGGDGLVPCGLGARDTLRLEAAMPLYGHEMDENTTPGETGLMFAVKMNKPFFVGKSALEEKGEPTRIRVGLKALGKGIIREKQTIYIGDTVIGVSTSGTFCPWLNGSYAMAIVDKKYSVPGTRVYADIRGRKTEAEIVALPFYSNAK